MAGFDGTGGDASLDEGPQSKPAFTGDRLLALLSVVLRRKPVVYTLTVVTDLRGSLPLFVSKSHNIAMVDEDSCSAHSIDEETYCAAQYC